MLRKLYNIKAQTEIYTSTLGTIDERMYVVKDQNNLLIVDPNICEELLIRISEWQTNHIIILLTHEHYDHITGVKWFLSHRKDTEVTCSQKCQEILKCPLVPVKDYYDVLIPDEEQNYYLNHGLLNPCNYIFDVTTTFQSNYSFSWGKMTIDCIIAPGHSIGGAIYVLDKKYVFTGDNLVNGNKVITRFPGGSRKDYLCVTKPILQSMEKDCIVFPGHGEMGTLRELLQYII